jgi:hypothetical protein
MPDLCEWCDFDRAQVRPSGDEGAEKRCPDCGGSGEIPVGVTKDFDSGMWECDDVTPCPRCTAGERADAIPAMVSVECGACRGTGEIESSDSTDDRWWTCGLCKGSGKRTFADRRRAAQPEAGGEEADLGRAASAMCAWLLEHVDEQTHQTLCELHPDVWKEAAEVAIRGGQGKCDTRPGRFRAAHPEAERAPEDEDRADRINH